ncbi:uncharacterized protein [Venturia canescens]|uniref:uncharacterized protein n=1 Tax=Venturia canescens TaxID=32260 RepID=UPI001C9CF26F|nr:uncharacterized protein LOC122416568 [Venturia canescens]
MRNCCKKCISCPKDSWFHKKSVLLRAEGSFENFVVKSVFGFLGGMFLTCVVFLLLPQIFSKRGRQALMAYAFVLTLTGPAKNTLHNTGVLSESLACGQEQLKEAVQAIIDLVKRPFHALRDALAKVIKSVKVVVEKIKKAILAIKRLILSIPVFEWLGSVINMCNKKLGTPFERCERAFDGAVTDCHAKLGPIFGAVCSLAYIAGAVCYVVKPLDFICMLVSFVADGVANAVGKRIKRFTKHMNAMFYVKLKFSHSFKFETNKSQTLSDVSTGIVTEIRSRTDRFLTVFDWMSIVTSFFIFITLLRVIYYRQKWLTNERFDNRYLTKDLRQIDLIRAKNDKETVLPLNPRERNKYIPLTSIALIKVEKVQLAKSAVFLGLTTFKLCIHMMADYSLYWVLSTIRYHGRFETKVQRHDSVSVYVSGDGYLAELYRSIVRAFTPYGPEVEMDTVPCLPDPMPPDLDRYTQIVSLIIFCWIMAIFEPYGLRLRQVVMTYYHPQRAQQRAVWLYNYIIRDSSDDQQATARRKAPTTIEIIEEIEVTDESEPEVNETDKFLPKSKKIGKEFVPEVEKPTKPKSLQNNEETADFSSSTEYSQSYQDEEPGEIDSREGKRVRYRDVEAQKLRDDVTIQIFNEPLKGDTTSGDESPTSCFLVRAHRRLRSRLKRKSRSSPGRDYSSSSPSDSIARTESFHSGGTEDDDITHINIEDDDGAAQLAPRTRKKTRKKRNSVGKIDDTFARSKDNGDEHDRVRGRPRSKESEKFSRYHEHLESWKSDGEQYEDCLCSSESLEYSSEDDCECPLIKGSTEDWGESSSRRRGDSSLRKERPREDYKRESSWEYHRRSGDDDASSFSQNYDGDRFSRRLSALSRDTRYSEINEIRLNKLSDGKSSPETGRTEESSNITDSEDKQGTSSEYSGKSQENDADSNFYSVGMSTINEDSKELSRTDNETDDTGSKQAFERESNDYVDVTGFSSTTSDSPKEKRAETKRPMAVMEKEIESSRPAARKRRKKIIRKIREQRDEAANVADPMAGLEIYGVRGKKKQKARSWVREEIVEIYEEDSGKTEDADKSVETGESGETEKTTETENPEEGETSMETGKSDQVFTASERIRGGGVLTEMEKCTKTGRFEDGEKSKGGKFEETLAEMETEFSREKTVRGRIKPEMGHSKQIKPSEVGPNYEEYRSCIKKKKQYERRYRRENREPEKCERPNRRESESDDRFRNEINQEECFHAEQRKLWEQMCAKMAEHSHRSGCPNKSCESAQNFPHDGCTIPMYNPNLFRPPIQGHTRPRFPRRVSSQEQSRESVSPVSRRILPCNQRPDSGQELELHDRVKLIGERDERRRKCDCEEESGSTMDRDAFSRGILPRPSPAQLTGVIPSQGTESFGKLGRDYKTVMIPNKPEESSREGDEVSHSLLVNDSEPLVSSSNFSKSASQILTPEQPRKRSSILTRMSSTIACVFKKALFFGMS